MSSRSRTFRYLRILAPLVLVILLVAASCVAAPAPAPAAPEAAPPSEAVAAPAPAPNPRSRRPIDRRWWWPSTPTRPTWSRAPIVPSPSGARSS